jgi:hypothetical protein
MLPRSIEVWAHGSFQALGVKQLFQITYFFIVMP